MPRETVQQAFELALRRHQAGHLREAEQIYREVLAEQPEHSGATHYLGVIALQTGRGEVALELLSRALALRPDYAEAYFNLGNALNGLGRVEGAIDAYGQAVAIKPNLADAHNNLGNVLKKIGRMEEAIAAYRRVIVLKPRDAKAHVNLGIALKQTGRVDEAIAAYGEAIALEPNLAEAHHKLGIARQGKGQLDEAITEYRQAIALKPDAEVFCSLGNALQDQGQLDEAAAAHRQAIALRRDFAEAHYNLGNVLQDERWLEEAIVAYHQSLALRPDYVEAHNNLGNAFRKKGQFDDAAAAYRRAIALSPSNADAHSNLALVLLLRGEYEEGWWEFEWRWKVEGFASCKPWLERPFWDGNELAGRTILLHGEQGFGDVIQFVRYVPLTVERGGRVILGVRPELVRLLRRLPGVERCITVNDPLPDFDVHCPLQSLPRLFRTTLQSIPLQRDPLLADLELVRMWGVRVGKQPSGLKVGLVWAGNPKQANDRNRSMTLSTLAPLADLPGIQFFSLQKGEAGKQAADSLSRMAIVDWATELGDFADTAALMANLDLIISVDTAVAHLAGAMGKPVWVLLTALADWRWLQVREDSPWYPTMRLFRQSTAGSNICPGTAC
jgi:tetratricopeptide (TPR) repeat protein